MFSSVGRSQLRAGQMRVVDVHGTGVMRHMWPVACTRPATRASNSGSLAKGELDGTTVTCACQGSQFDVPSGNVVRGPAERPVRARAVQVAGDDVLVEA